MNASFSRTQFPNGGFQYHDPRIGWTAPTPKSSTFDQTVQLIIASRRKNPAALLKHGLSLDPVNVGNELEAFTRRRLGIAAPAPSPISIFFPGDSQQVVNSPAEIRKLALGMGLLLAWERSGEGRVPLEIFEYRMAKCLNCPMNSIGKFEEWAKSHVGTTAKEKTPNTSALTVGQPPKAEGLGLCTGCHAPTNRLCVMPMTVIAKRVGDKEKAGLDEKCWMRV